MSISQNQHVNTPKKRVFQAASNRLAIGTRVALLPNRVLELPGVSFSDCAEDEPSIPGLRGLLAALGVQQSPAAVRAQVLAGQGLAPGFFYVALELCYWQIEMGGARFMAHGERLNLADAERAEITAALASLFATPDAQLIAHRNGELSLLCDAATPKVHAIFPDEALGSELKNWLPTPNVWQRYLNEAQMLLANLPVNRARAARGEVVVNSVWFWGAQTVCGEFKPMLLSYQGDDAILRALSSPAMTDAVQIYDYRALYDTELAAAVAQLPSTAKLWLNDGRVFEECARGGFLQRLWRSVGAKMRGIRS